MMSRLLKRSAVAAIAALAVVLVSNAALAEARMDVALLNAIYSGDLEKVKKLIAEGSDVNEAGARPLYAAAFKDQLEIAKFLVSAGANVNGVMTYGSTTTALRVAAIRARYTKNYEMVDYLLSVGADPSVAGKTDQDPALMIAVMTGHLDQVKKVIGSGGVDLEFQKPPFKPEFGKGMTALMIAAQRGFSEIVEYLVERGAKVNTSHGCGQTALNYAAASGSVRMVKLLIGKGANVSPTTAQACPTPIVDAVAGCYAEVIDILRDHGANYAPAAEPFEQNCNRR